MSPTTYTDKLSKWGAKLDSIDMRITELQNQRESIVTEIEGLMSGSPSGAKVGSTAKKGPSLADKIVPLLQTNPGQDAKTIATRLKIAPNRVGLSLFHLTQKGSVYKNSDNSYFVTPATATKTVETEG